MKPEFEPYKDRKIDYIKNIFVDGICVKVYTISNKEKFEADITFNKTLELLPKWTANIKKSTIPTHRNAFLMIHEAREGILILLCWFTGENMIETNIYYADFKNPSEINPSIYKERQLVCIWELEIVWHERKAWIKHILSNSNNPNFIAYQKDIYIQKL